MSRMVKLEKLKLVLEDIASKTKVLNLVLEDIASKAKVLDQ